MTLESGHLDAVAVRVLGAMIEKEHTTPDAYPLTINALTAACNQTTNREPVMSLDEASVTATIHELSRRNLVREVVRPDSRAKRFRQTFTETLHLHQPETAAMCVLMLRGPQTTGEVRTRSGRIFEFIDLKQVELTLDALMSLATPLVALLPRQAGQKEQRYAHLLSGEPEIPPVVERERAPAEPSRMEKLENEVAELRAEVAQLRSQVEELRGLFS